MYIKKYIINNREIYFRFETEPKEGGAGGGEGGGEIVL